MVAFKPDFAVKYQQHRPALRAVNQGGGVNPNLAPQRLQVDDGVEPAHVEPARIGVTPARAKSATIESARAGGVVTKDGPLP